jgi:hypothetical protein
MTTYQYLDITRDGAATWENLDIVAPLDDPDIFEDYDCRCGMYNPYLRAVGEGSVRLSCSCNLGGSRVKKNYLYQTIDGGASWDIQSMPAGELHYIGAQTFYATGQEIYRTDDGGKNWDLIKTVNWEGQFSFLGIDKALVVAYDSVDEEYALVSTDDGCATFQIIPIELLTSQTNR